ncbi:MAG: ABC transporter permease [Candidatus Melainabacteria bacterium]
MIRWLLLRVLSGVLTLFCLVSITFVLLRLMPGGPFDEERSLPPAIKASIEERYHLNAPIPEQYVRYLGTLLQGDLGPSFKYQSRSVNDIVGEATAVSAQIGVLALLLGVLSGTILGAIAGITRQRWLDGLLSLTGVSCLSIPAFILGGLLVLTFALTWNILPAATLTSPAHYILPVITLSLAPFAYAFLLVRNTVQETKNATYVHIKHSMGLPARTIAIRHVLRNSLIPLVSILGPIAAAILTGSFAVEFIFAVPGLGKHFVTAVTNRDYTLVMGITIVYSVTLIVFNMLTDILYGFLDPRLREDAGA